MRPLIVALAAVGLGVATWCCGPKVEAPAIAPSCPGEKFEVCEPGSGELAEHSCICPEE